MSNSMWVPLIFILSSSWWDQSPVIDHDVLVKRHVGAPWKAGNPVRHIQLVLVSVPVEHVHQLMIAIIVMIILIMVMIVIHDDDDGWLMATWVNLVVGLGKRWKGNLVPLTQSAVSRTSESWKGSKLEFCLHTDDDHWSSYIHHNSCWSSHLMIVYGRTGCHKDCARVGFSFPDHLPGATVHSGPGSTLWGE